MYWFLYYLMLYCLTYLHHKILSHDKKPTVIFSIWQCRKFDQNIFAIDIFEYPLSHSKVKRKVLCILQHSFLVATESTLPHSHFVNKFAPGPLKYTWLFCTSIILPEHEKNLSRYLINLHVKYQEKSLFLSPTLFLKQKKLLSSRLNLF